MRAGGKHNDLDNVGYTARHHTFFEMLGNFSFGDYFKERAIELAWRLLVKEFGLDKDRLTVTVYHDDEEAYRIWKKITGFGADKIIRIATNDNFWQMGDTGPCGPVLGDLFRPRREDPRRPARLARRRRRPLRRNLEPRVHAVRAAAPGNRIALPKPSVDTGMGLERVSAVLEGTHDNYEIDLFKALIAASVAATGVLAKGEHKASHRVIADHLRSSSFLIADGVLPSNEGRGYVLRRIMRRAMRHAHLLGAAEPLMYRLVPALVHEMGDTYHELQRAEPLITETLHLEEDRFRRTLSKGLGLLSDATRQAKEGRRARRRCRLQALRYVRLPARSDRGRAAPARHLRRYQGFDAAMDVQREEARKAWKGSGEAATETIWFQLKETLGATEFLGYEEEIATGEITAIVKGGKEAKSLKAGDEAAIIVNQTPFYGESGGQVGDTGVIVGAKGARFTVTDTQKKAGGLFIHLGKVESGSFKKGDTVDLEVEHANRSAIRANHSATHLLHEALRQVLGDHVAQRGSLVAPDRLRFDFVHTKPMTAEEVARVEDIANALILQNAPVETRLMGIEDAKQSGARALFGEKYGDEVRVVSMGKPTGNGLGWSVELCGGTHAKSTGDIGLVKVIGESASASGVRRIEAFTGNVARAYLASHEATPQGNCVGAARAARGCGRARQGAHRGAQATRARAGRCQEADRARRRHGRRRWCTRRKQHQDGRQRKVDRAHGAGIEPQGPARVDRRRQEAGRLRHRGDCRRDRRRQGRARGRRHRGSDQDLERRRSGARGRRSARRQRRRRPSRHGAGRRARRRQGGRRVAGDRGASWRCRLKPAKRRRLGI